MAWGKVLVAIASFNQITSCSPFVLFALWVQQPGVLQAGDALTLVARSPYAVTIQDMAAVYAPGPQDPVKLAAIQSLPTLSPSWRERVGRLLVSVGA
jgi:MOSC domain-containing protein YiiM